jgi:hypothetical protein
MGRDVQLDAYFLAEVVTLETVRDEGLEHVVFRGRAGRVVCEEALVDEFVDLAGWEIGLVSKARAGCGGWSCSRYHGTEPALTPIAWQEVIEWPFAQGPP